VDVAVFAGHADLVEFCLLDPLPDGGWHEHRVPLQHQTHGVWHGFVPDVAPGRHYGLRAHGPWEPHQGHRYNPAKLLLDPYARAVTGPPRPGPQLYGHAVDAEMRGDPAVRDERDSAAHAPHAVLIDPGTDPHDDVAPKHPWSQTVIYEAHVKGLTSRLPGVPEPLRGTYAGLAHPATVQHLLDLGVTAVELLPVHAFADEPELARRGLSNYWGYNTMAFFAPHPPYAAAWRQGAGDPAAVVAEFRDMVRALHAAGLEVLLDVVYNHTCEADVSGMTLSWRGLDAATYYRMDGAGNHIDVTGCGNTLDARRTSVVQMILDSLRYWVSEMRVDGFRFDLAPALARGRDGFDPDHPLLVALRTDPVLADVKLIAEPWDLGPHGWRTGQFPPPFVEWNDRFRNTVREFWLVGGARAARGDASDGIRDLATRLAGSADVFEAARGPVASVNFVTAHDGFTLADCTAYDTKHNEANREDNRDGSDDNRSYNHGVEGPTTDAGIAAARLRTIRNLLTTLLLSSGVPMLLAGDESGRTQQGNNNAYCQDNPISWLDWESTPWRQDLLATTRALLRLRREHAVLRQERFFAGRPVRPDGTKDLAWFAPEGQEMDHSAWHDPRLRTLQMYLQAPVGGQAGTTEGGSLLVVVAGLPGAVDVVLPGPPWAGAYRLLWDSSLERPLSESVSESAEQPPPRPAGTAVTVDGPAVLVFAALP
jgi:isoamylase